MKNLLITALLTGLSFSMCAQEDTLKNGYKLQGKEKYGYIITQDGKKVEGIVKLMGTKNTPWVNQQKVKFVDKESINESKKKQNFDKLKVDDLKEYVAYENDGTKRHFRVIKYLNKQDEARNNTVDNDPTSKMKTAKTSATTDHMAEVIVDGKITMYRLYGYPNNAAVSLKGKETPLPQQNDEQNIIDNPILLYQKESGKLKELHVADVKGLVKDCSPVATKLAAGQYKSYDPAKEEKPQTDIDRLIKHKMDMAGDQVLTVGIEVFADYNTNCQ